MRSWQANLPAVLSLVFHGALLLALLYRWHPPSALEKRPLFVDLAPLPDDAPKAVGAGGNPVQPSKQKTLGLAKPLPLRAFAPRSSVTQPVAPGQIKQAPVPNAFSPIAQSQDPFTMEKPESFAAITWAHNKLQLTLGYPAAFVSHNISGQAEAHFSFGEDGRLLPGSLNVQADSPYLRVYVHRLIEKTFAGSEVPENLRKWRNQLEILCFVRFSLVESATALSTGVPFMGNRLYFTRQSVKSELERLKWQVGPLHGMFPIPAVGVDMLWFARKAQEINHPRAPVDELAPYREDPLFYN